MSSLYAITHYRGQIENVEYKDFNDNRYIAYKDLSLANSTQQSGDIV